MDTFRHRAAYRHAPNCCPDNEGPDRRLFLLSWKKLQKILEDFIDPKIAKILMRDFNTITPNKEMATWK